MTDTSNEAAPEAAAAVSLAETCGNCRGFHPMSPDGRLGQCRMRVPQVLLLGIATDMANRKRPMTDGFFPPTGIDLWCCEFKRRETALPALPDLSKVPVVGPEQ